MFGMVTSNIRFRERELLARYLRAMSERIGRPVSDNKPIIDGVLLDGSRINIIFSDDVSMLGPSFTIRKFAEETISVIQLIKWGTMSAQQAAYIWICLEYGCPSWCPEKRHQEKPPPSTPFCRSSTTT